MKPDRIGHLIGEIDQFLRLTKLSDNKNNKKRIIITGHACNQTAVKIMNRHVKIFQNIFIYGLLDFARREINHISFLKPLGLTQTLFTLYNKVDKIVYLTNKELEDGYSLIKNKYGLLKSDWWVCFHARDEAYTSSDYLKNNNKSDLSYHDYRNGNIDNMLLAMDYVTSLGGYAIRFGSIAEERLNTENKNIIDDTFNGRSDFLDIFLVAQSKFFIGNTSGTYHIAKLFSVPYAITNLIGFLMIPEQPKSLYIPKKIQDKSGKTLTFEQCNKIGMFDQEKGKAFSFSDKYNKMKLTVLENTEEEILGCVKDMFDMVSQKKINKGLNLKQENFMSRYYSNYKDRRYAGKISPSFIETNNILF